MIAQARIVSLLALGAVALAQTYSSCNPTENSSCPSDTALSSRTYTVDFTQGASDNWTVTSGSIDYTSLGAEFTINKAGDAPTIETEFYIFFGSVSFYMRAANGTGIVSSAILESDDVDEIDLEWLGGSVDQVQSNYFGKGNTTSYDRVEYHDVSETQSTSHNYTILWTANATTWYIDGAAMRTLEYDQAVSGKNYPQTPMKVKLGIWAGGDSGNDEGTIEWAGGETDYGQAPFTMVVEKVEINNWNPAQSYIYSDTSGDWASIKLDNSTISTAATGSNSSEASPTTTGMSLTASASALKQAAESSSSVSSIDRPRVWLGVVAGICMMTWL